MKIALLTIHNANNYGAILQAFAMQEVLKRYGKVEIINYRNRHISRSFDLIRLKPSFHGVLGLGKDIFRLLPRYRAIKKFRGFIRENFQLTREYTFSDLQNGICAGYDIYVAGSDQIWNPDCVNSNSRLDETYFLDFSPSCAKKISYASSVGGYIYSDEEEEIVKRLLSAFDSLSVREKGTRDYLSGLIHAEVEHVVDPSLLLSKKEWLEKFNQTQGGQLNEPYVLLYTVPKVGLIKDTVDFFRRKLGLKIIALDQSLTAGAKVDQQVRDAGPEDFIRLFANASFVITDSFHGTCFALNFEKPFVAVSPGKHSNRVESLLEAVGSENRLVNSQSDFRKIPDEIDYKDITPRLEHVRQNAISYLIRSL